MPADDSIKTPESTSTQANTPSTSQQAPAVGKQVQPSSALVQPPESNNTQINSIPTSPTGPLPETSSGPGMPGAPLPPSISGAGENQTSGLPLTERSDTPPGSALPAIPDQSQPGRNGLTSTVSMPSAPPQDLSIKDMFMNADAVVQSVMILLLLASIATWIIIFEKTLVLRRASQGVMLFKRVSARYEDDIKPDSYPEVTRPVVKAGLKESADSAGNETRSDYRERVERSMRAELSGLMDRLGYRSLFLATVGSVSPFIGLFGTVWGIMNSFVGIAASGETTLAVVAPGIAEALFATAMGLVAAIPAVIAYNKITGALKKITKEALSGIGFLGNRLARQHYSSKENAV